LKGSVKPHASITKGLTNPNGIAIDHAGTLYVADLVPYGTSDVQVYTAGSKSPSRTITAGVTWPVGIGVDPNGTLYVTNDAQCNVEEYRAGQSQPYREITEGINGPNSVTFSTTGRLYLVDEGFNGCSGPWPVVLEFRPGSLKPTKKMISTGLHSPVGSAYYPPLLP
jgi:serine/threonine-protein kinase